LIVFPNANSFASQSLSDLEYAIGEKVRGSEKSFVLSAFSNEIKLISLALGFISPEKRTKILNLMVLNVLI